METEILRHFLEANLNQYKVPFMWPAMVGDLLRLVRKINATFK